MKCNKEFDGLAELGGPLKTLKSGIRHFMSYFWCKFGREDARSLAEAHRAEVCSFCDDVLFVFMFLFLSFYDLILISYAGYEGCGDCLRGTGGGGSKD